MKTIKLEPKGAIQTRNHVIRCHTAAFAAVCMLVAFCNLHEKVENRLFAPESKVHAAQLRFTRTICGNTMDEG